VTGAEQELERLRAAFAAVADGAEAPGDEADVERIWQAVRGELPVAETRELVERAAACPETAEAWRVARELNSDREVQRSAEVIPISASRRWRWVAGLAAAAALVIGVVVPLYRAQVEGPQLRFRDAGAGEVRSLLSESEPVPRERFLLRWTPGPEGALYDVLVADEGLEVLARANRLEEAEYLVPAEALADLPSGAAVLWKVELTTPTGERFSSTTFVQRLPTGR